VNARTVKWAIGVVVILVAIGVGALVALFVIGFISLEKGEQHRRQLQAEQAKLNELNERLDTLQRELETLMSGDKPQPSGKRP